MSQEVKTEVRMFVGNISYSADDREVLDFLSRIAAVKSFRLSRNHENGESRGFGFAHCLNRAEAEKLLEANGKKLNGRPLYVAHAKEKNQS